MDAKMIKNRGQVTIFIIVAIVLVGGILLFFLLYQRAKISFLQPKMPNPQEYMEKCAKDAASQAVDIVLSQGGYLNPENYKLYQNNRVAYLCYTTLFYRTCIIQEPVYIKHLEQEITNYTIPKLEKCFSNLKTDLEGKQYSVDMSNMQVSTELSNRIVKINTERILIIGKNGEEKRFEIFKAALNSPLYNLALVAIEIANQEAKYCNFEYVGYMLFYPSYNIDKKKCRTE